MERIDHPTPEDVRHHLQHLPKDAPFLILSADEELYIQVALFGNGYRVELRQGGVHRYVLVSLAGAEELVQAFLGWDQSQIESVVWTRLKWWDRHSRAIVITLIAFTFAIGLWRCWRAFNGP